MPISPRSEQKYRRALERAFGRADLPLGQPKIDGWGEPSKETLRNAIVWAYGRAGRADEGRALAKARVPKSHRVKRQVRIPGEDDAQAYEKAARKLPAGRRALALLPLALGLRAEEVCSLRREDVERAIRTGELTFLRKGAEEHTLRVEGAKVLLSELLAAPRASGRRLRSPLEPPGEPWARAGEILSPCAYPCQYKLLARLVRQTAATAEIGHLSPHKLRHAFATRMSRDGAPLYAIMYALNHKQITTTTRYVHMGAADAAKYMRPF